MALVLVLAARGWLPFGEDQPTTVTLQGRTERGDRITIALHDGRLRSFDTSTGVRCPSLPRKRYGWRWYGGRGDRLPKFRQDGDRFYVRQVNHYPTAEPPQELSGEMSGVVTDDGRSAHGSISARGLWMYRDGAVACAGTVRFSVRAVP